MKNHPIPSTLVLGTSAIVVGFAFALLLPMDASANPRNKFSDGSTASVDISTNDSDLNVNADNGDISLDTTKNIESFNVDVEVIGSKEMSLTVSSNSVIVSGSANGGGNSCATGAIGLGAGCVTVKNDGGSGNGGNVSANTGGITIGTNAFQFFGGVNSQANNTGNNVAQVADTVMPVNATVNFR